MTLPVIVALPPLGHVDAQRAGAGLILYPVVGDGSVLGPALDLVPDPGVVEITVGDDQIGDLADVQIMPEIMPEIGLRTLVVSELAVSMAIVPVPGAFPPA